MAQLLAHTASSHDRDHVSIDKLDEFTCTLFQGTKEFLNSFENFSGETFHWPDMPRFHYSMLCVPCGKSCDTFHPTLVVGKEPC